MNWLWVFVGGGLGSMLRYGISLWLKSAQNNLPFATIATNLIATLFLGLIVFEVLPKTESSAMKLFLITGFCGGFSTFSTFSMETFALLQTNWWWAIVNILVSVAGGILILWFLSRTIPS